MFQRSIQTELESLMSSYPVVTITGPRQSGKTTLARTAYPNRPYYSLENPDTAAMIAEDPKGFLSNIDLNQGVILDEIQTMPTLLSYIQGIVDQQRVPGSFILTGSHQLQLAEAITQSLAGRTALLELFPLSINELKTQQVPLSVDVLLWQGFFPGVHQYHLDPTKNARHYVKTHIERDVRQIVNIQNTQTFHKFIQLCASRVGSIINKESMSNDIDISQGSIRNWLSLLEASYLIYQLPPYYENFGKRLIKTPKLYFTDVGLAAYLLQIYTQDQIAIDKHKGHLFENMIVMEMLKYFYNRGEEANLYFYRDSNQNEVDVVIKVRDYLIPVEIKSSATFNTPLLKGLKSFKKLVGDRAPFGFLVYGGEHEQRLGDFEIISYQNVLKMLSKVSTLFD